MDMFDEYNELCDKCLSWIDGDLSLMEKDDRFKLYETYSWMFSDCCGDLPTLEPLISDSRRFSYRERFREWFLVVCDCSLSPLHMGETSYYHFMRHPHWEGKKDKGNKIYPQRVILSLGMMGIFTGMKTDYLHLNDKSLDHCREYVVDLERLQKWTSTSTATRNDFSEMSLTSINDSWETSTVESDFDYSFLEEEDNMTWRLHNDWLSFRQYSTISSITVLPDYYENATRFINSMTYQSINSTDDKGKRKTIRGQYRNCKWLVNLGQHKIGCCKVDDKGGRFYSMMVGMGKDYRRECLRLEGERIVEVDVSSSQPTLIGLKIKRETGKTTRWLEHCLKGDFYEWVKGLTETKVKRDRVKKYVMRFLYSCYEPNLPMDFQGEHLPREDNNCKKGYKKFEKRLLSYLKNNEPEIFDLIDFHKKHPSWTEKTWTDCWRKTHKGRWCSSLPVEMQKVEVEFIKTCLSRLPEDVKFYTIHDSICVKYSDGDNVKKIMEDVSEEMYGERIAVKIENSQD